MSFEEKDGRSLANANSLVENENQDHEYSQNETPEPCQAVFEGKGESAERKEKAISQVTRGRHVVSGKDGLDVAKEREAHVKSKRAETEAIFAKPRR